MNVAELTLRFGATRLQASVYWPRTDARWLALVLSDEMPLVDSLLADCLVLALAGSHSRVHELAGLQWLAEHGGELGPAPNRLMVGGGARAAWLAVEGRDGASPVLHRQLLMHPRFAPEIPMPSSVVGLAPATIVCSDDPRDDGRRYAALLRDAGVAVDEVLR